MINRKKVEIEHVVNRELHWHKDKKGWELLYRLELAISNTFWETVKDDCYNYIPFSHAVFEESVKRLEEQYQTDSGLKFLEVGCGLGSNLWIANKYFAADGIEINHTFAKIAQNLWSPGHREPKIYVQDAREFEH